MSLVIAQKTSQQAAASAQVSFTLTNVPNPGGNILVAFCAYSQFSTTRTISAPSASWTKVFDVTNSANLCSLACFWYQVRAGDGKTWTFPVAGSSSDNTSGMLWEISGAELTNPINQSATGDVPNGTNNSVTTPSVTPSVIGCLALGTWTFDTNLLTFSSVSAGWTLDGQDDATFHGTYNTSKNTLTTDTSTAINVTITATGSPATNDGETATVLIAPARAHFKFNNSAIKPHLFSPGNAR